MTVDRILQAVLSLNTSVTLDRYLTLSAWFFLHKEIITTSVGFTVTDLGAHTLVNYSINVGC